ncbi:MAG: tRNA pseudouridine(65) synthase TruC, partial [Mariprofundaceae bacterium]|nr:tRNA pseudouridine(65) synthase TruC [Mariprofundaceae bacterium]
LRGIKNTMDINGICISSIEDEHGSIYVYQTKTGRVLSFDGKIYQSYMKLKNIHGLALGYTQAMMAGLLFIPSVKTATLMGLGAGSMAKNLLSSFPELNVHAIEYREAVVKAAREHFYLPDTDRLFIHIDDAVNHIKNTDIKSDIIFSDLYNSQGMEPKQVQSSYLRDCKKALSEQGVLVLNIWHTSLQLREELDELLAYEFENRLLSFEVDSGNTIVLAFKNDIPLIERKALLSKAKCLQAQMNIPIEPYAKLLCDTQPETEELDILYQDDVLVAVHKPAGLLVHRSMIDKYETRFALQMVRNQVGQHVYPVHRLDKPTSGVLLFALNPEIAKLMGEKFANRDIAKTYVAVVRGYSVEQETINYPLKEELDKKTDKKADQEKAAQEAVTAYERLATVELDHAVGRYATARYSLVKIKPKTGRKHQIRRHMKHIFHPIVGDTTHGDGKHNQLFRDVFDCHRLLLAATSLSFKHPLSGQEVVISAALDGSFQAIMERFGWQDAAVNHISHSPKIHSS